VKLRLNRQPPPYIAGLPFSRLTYLRKVYLESSECVKGDATKRRIILWLPVETQNSLSAIRKFARRLRPLPFPVRKSSYLSEGFMLTPCLCAPSVRPESSLVLRVCGSDRDLSETTRRRRLQQLLQGFHIREVSSCISTATRIIFRSNFSNR
jgi:hypothetical protein